MADNEKIFSEVTDALSSPGFFDGEPGAISIIDTHVSKIFLFENDVFKLKKVARFKSHLWLHLVHFQQGFDSPPKELGSVPRI